MTGEEPRDFNRHADDARKAMRQNREYEALIYARWAAVAAVKDGAEGNPFDAVAESRLYCEFELWRPRASRLQFLMRAEQAQQEINLRMPGAPAGPGI